MSGSTSSDPLGNEKNDGNKKVTVVKIPILFYFIFLPIHISSPSFYREVSLPLVLCDNIANFGIDPIQGLHINTDTVTYKGSLFRGEQP